MPVTPITRTYLPVPTASGTGSVTGSGTSVLWASDATVATPFNFDAVQNGTESSGYGYSTGTRVTDSQVISEYPTALTHINHFEGGQMDFGGGIGATTVGSFWSTIETADTFFLRFIIKYGTADNAAEWAGSWSNGASGGHEYKFPDIGSELDGNRVIVMHQPDGNTSTGKIQVRIDGTGGQVEYPVATGLVSNTLYYVEIEINGATDVIRSWVAEYDGTDTEYVEGTTTTSDTGHGWAPDYLGGISNINFGYINHNCVPAQDRYFEVAINDSFIGPGPVTSEN